MIIFYNMVVVFTAVFIRRVIIALKPKEQHIYLPCPFELQSYFYEANILKVPCFAFFFLSFFF